MMMALYLALIDPASAKQVLQAIEPHSDCIGSGYSGIWRSGVVQGLGPGRSATHGGSGRAGVGLGQGPQGKAGCGKRPRWKWLSLWLTPPGDRLKNISERYRHMFPPVEEF